MDLSDLDQRIDGALDDGDTEAAAELLAARRALAEEETPRLGFDALAGDLPIRATAWWKTWWAAGSGVALAAAAAAIVALGPTEHSGVKGPGETCAPVDLRVARHDDALELHPTVDPACRFSVHAVDLDSGRWRPVSSAESKRLELGPGRWVIAVVAAPRALELTRSDVIAILNAVGDGRPPTGSGERVYVDVYEVGDR
jgi:hypothetical protein